MRHAELTTDKIPGCPTLKTPAQVVFYTANAGYTGPDHTKYEVTSENGEVATYDVTITVKAGEPGQTPPAARRVGSTCDVDSLALGRNGGRLLDLNGGSIAAGRRDRPSRSR